MDIKTIFNKEPKTNGDASPLLYDFLESSESADFYFKQFSVQDTEKIKLSDRLAPVPSEMLPIIDFLRKNLSSDAVIIELGGSWHQNRSGNPYFHFPNYFPLDISFTSMYNYTKRFERGAIVSNAEQLPFKDKSIDAIFTHTFLEHPIHPENVLEEIVRVLKPGGIVIH